MLVVFNATKVFDVENIWSELNQKQEEYIFWEEDGKKYVCKPKLKNEGSCFVLYVHEQSIVVYSNYIKFDGRNTWCGDDRLNEMIEARLVDVDQLKRIYADHWKTAAEVVLTAIELAEKTNI